MTDANTVVANTATVATSDPTFTKSVEDTVAKYWSEGKTEFTSLETEAQTGWSNIWVKVGVGAVAVLAVLIVAHILL